MAVKNLVTQAEPVPAARLGRVHFAGIGGAGMSGIARIMLARGIGVSGSDARDSALLGELRELGASVRVGHAAGNLGHLGPGDTLVVSSAIRPDNPELAEAARRGMRVVHRAAALASVMAGRRVIAVAGTHGKTTTTSMLTTVLRAVRGRPRLRHRRDPHRDRARRGGRIRPGLRGRGGRERRVIPAAVARPRDHHQRRGRSPGQLREPGGHPGRVHHVRPARQRHGSDLRRRPGRRGCRGAPGSRARAQVRGVPARGLPAHRRGVPGDGDQLHRGGRPRTVR